MKYIKKLIVVLCIFCLFLSGCSTKSLAAIYDDDAKIAKTGDSYSKSSKTEIVSGQQLTAEVSKMVGMATFWTMDAKEDTEIEMTYSIKVKSGKVKIVLIAPDDTVTTLIELTENSELDDYATNTFTATKGKNRLKLVAGSGTKMDLDITLSDGTVQSLGFIE